MEPQKPHFDARERYGAIVSLFAVGPAMMVMVGLWIVIGAGSAAQRDVVVAVTFWSIIVALSTFLAAQYWLRKRREVIQDCIDTALAMSTDERNVLVRHASRQDEFGELSRALIAIQKQMQALRSAGEAADVLRVQKEVEADVARSVSHWRRSFRAAMDQSMSLNQSVRETAQSLAEQVKQAAHDAAVAREASGEGSLAVAGLAAAVDQITGAVREINERANDSARMVRQASEAGNQAGVHVNQLASTVRRIGNVVTSIRAIAEQTNLLALNATIEAARAGEAGKGFAVVASEVKSLATETARATAEITSLVASIQSVTADAVGATQGISRQLDLVEQTSRVIVHAVEEQEASTNEIARASTNAARFSMAAHEKFQAIEAIILAAGAAAYQLDGVTTRISSESVELASNMDRMLAEVARGAKAGAKTAGV